MTKHACAWGIKPHTAAEAERRRREQEFAELDASQLFEPWEWPTLPGYRPARKRKPRKPRKPSIRAQVAAAEKAGKTVTSITLPDGTVLQFGEPPTEASPWRADLTKMRKQ